MPLPSMLGGPAIRVGDRMVGRDHPAYLIAEIGSNHDGDFGRAVSLLRAAAAAGAGAVKFQSFRAAALTVPRRHDRGAWREEPAYRVLRGLELPAAWHARLAREAAAAGVHFLSTPFSEAAVGQVERAGAPAIKVASGDLTHEPLLRRAARSGRPILLSTGLATEAEVARALAVIGGRAPVALLHCVACYPPRMADLNLRALAALARFGRVVGLSDHTPGHTAALGAVALGARVIEKHLTDDRRRPGPDHGYAMLPDEFAAMAREVRELQAALGDGVKRPAAAEAAGRVAGRRGLWAARDLPAGAVLTRADLKVVRPAIGLAPGRLADVVGRPLARALRADEPITEDALARAAGTRGAGWARAA